MTAKSHILYSNVDHRKKHEVWINEVDFETRCRKISFLCFSKTEKKSDNHWPKSSVKQNNFNMDFKTYLSTSRPILDVQTISRLPFQVWILDMFANWNTKSNLICQDLVCTNSRLLYAIQLQSKRLGGFPFTWFFDMFRNWDTECLI